MGAPEARSVILEGHLLLNMGMGRELRREVSCRMVLPSTRMPIYSRPGNIKFELPLFANIIPDR